MDSSESAALTAVEVGSAREAQVALARLMTVAAASFERRAQLETVVAGNRRSSSRRRCRGV